jgi:hypothetical protein
MEGFDGFIAGDWVTGKNNEYFGRYGIVAEVWNSNIQPRIKVKWWPGLEEMVFKEASSALCCASSTSRSRTCPTGAQRRSTSHCR